MSDAKTPAAYANAFDIIFSNADITVAFAFNGERTIAVTMPYAVLHQLQMAAKETIETYERETQTQVVSVKDLADRLRVFAKSQVRN
jgi:hypothetical protein